MVSNTVMTFLELGDATARNLEFSRGSNVAVSYGEETITETNLLEIRRRHARRVWLQMFPKWKEAKNGADWEWRIVGRKRTLKMRIQAKRLQRNNVLKVRHKVKSTGRQQRGLLMAEAKSDGFKPVYCIYCPESECTKWAPLVSPGFEGYRTGCLLADAHDVPLHVTSLKDIEDKCFPWHYLFNRSVYAGRVRELALKAPESAVGFIVWREDFMSDLIERPDDHARLLDTGWNPPTVDELNEDTGRDYDQTGVAATTERDLARLQPDTDEGRRVSEFDQVVLRERGVHRMLVIDVRDDS